eukprot:scaffold62767_cov64-Phaeocystis_antarctica.AAC.3
MPVWHTEVEDWLRKVRGPTAIPLRLQPQGGPRLSPSIPPVLDHANIHRAEEALDARRRVIRDVEGRVYVARAQPAQVGSQHHVRPAAPRANADRSAKGTVLCKRSHEALELLRHLPHANLPGSAEGLNAEGLLAAALPRRNLSQIDAVLCLLTIHAVPKESMPVLDNSIGWLQANPPDHIAYRAWRKCLADRKLL